MLFRRFNYNCLRKSRIYELFFKIVDGLDEKSGGIRLASTQRLKLSAYKKLPFIKLLKMVNII